MAEFDDLLKANHLYAESFAHRGFDGIARAGVAMVTCMDSRLEPLEMIGLHVGDAKILRTPGAHVTPDAHVGCVLGVQKLGVERIMVVAHNKCAMASETEEQLHAELSASSGLDISDRHFGADPDQLPRLKADVAALRADPLIARAKVAGFMYDVDTGELTEVC